MASSIFFFSLWSRSRSGAKVLEKRNIKTRWWRRMEKEKEEEIEDSISQLGTASCHTCPAQPCVTGINKIVFRIFFSKVRKKFIWFRCTLS